MQEFIRAQDESNSPTKKLKCPFDNCNKEYTSFPGLKYHLLTHQVKDPQFSCRKCNKVFKRFEITCYILFIISYDLLFG